MEVIKRNGVKVPFDENKIFLALYAANESVFDECEDNAISESDIENVVERIKKDLIGKDEVSVEDIQDLVEYELVEGGHYYIAKAYIRYRYKKEVARNVKNDFIQEIRTKLSATNVQNQNANVDEYSFGGRTGEASGVVTKKLALDYIVSTMAKNNHNNNEIYIHDLDNYYVGSHNCLSIPFDDLLANGFNTRQTDIRPAGSVNTAFQLVAVIFQLQSLQQFGGVSATHIDWTMVPYVRKSFAKHYRDGLKYFSTESINDEIIYMLENIKDFSIEDLKWDQYNHKAAQYASDMTIKETHQAVEGLYHNLNTLQSRSGNQLPFTSINYGTCTLPEGRMVIKEILNVSLEGLGKLHRTSIFPCGIFQTMKGVNRSPGDPNYDLYKLALESTSKRLYPNYANVDWSGNEGYDRNDPRTYFSTMGLVA